MIKKAQSLSLSLSLAISLPLSSVSFRLPGLAYQKLPLLQADPVQKAHLRMAGCGPMQQDSMKSHRVAAMYRVSSSVETFLKDAKVPQVCMGRLAHYSARK